MASTMLHKSIKSLLKKTPFLTQSDISKKVKVDKVRLSGFLEAMVEYGDLSVQKLGNSKVYSLNKKVK